MYFEDSWRYSLHWSPWIDHVAYYTIIRALLLNLLHKSGHEKSAQPAWSAKPCVLYLLQEYWPINQFIYAAYQQDTKKMKKILKKESLNLDTKDGSAVDDEGKQGEITLLGTVLPS